MSTEATPPQTPQTISQSNEQSPQNKRRKAEQIDRVYVCQYKKCQKSYGSYPALYTHIKLKHSNQIRKGKSNKLPAKHLQYIKKIDTQKSPMQISTTTSTPQIEKQKLQQQDQLKSVKKQSLNELYSTLLETLQQIQAQQTYQAIEPENISEEFPAIQSLNKDILSPLKSELLQLKSPQTFARFSASNAGIQYKLAELLNYLGPMIKQDLYYEFCYFLGFFAKCISIRKITNIEDAQEDFEEIYQYIHDSIGYCTTFRFKYLKNGKIRENKDDLMLQTKKIIMDIIQITLDKWDEKIIPPFILA